MRSSNCSNGRRPVTSQSLACRRPHCLKDTTRAKDAGFYRYLTKPVKVAELTAVLEELLLGRRR